LNTTDLQFDYSVPDMAVTIKGCHLIGSVPLSDSEIGFRKYLAGMPSRLKRIPDSEAWSRIMFTMGQNAVFQIAPEMLINFEMNTEAKVKTFAEEEVNAGVAKLQKAGIETRYDTAAMESYAVFKRLRDEGGIPQGIKFQDGLPTVVNVVSGFIEKAFQPKVWPV
jgi:hypothetical protein